MMMSRPPSEQEKEKDKTPAFSSPPTTNAIKMGSVEDLERRLAMLGKETNKSKETTVTAPTVPIKVTETPAVVSPPPTTAPTTVKGGKNALLARIMAAKEKQEKKKASQAAAPAPVNPCTSDHDLLKDFDAPTLEKDPPPSYNTNFLKDAPPPSFDIIEQQQQNFPPPPPIDSVLPPPPPLDEVLPPPPPENFLALTPSAPAATAPMFEELLEEQTQQQQQQLQHPPAMPPPMQSTGALDIDKSILDALEPAEREAFLQEQQKIMEQIEKEKSNNEASNAAARAMAFDQKSTAAVANVAASYDGRGSSRWRSKPFETPAAVDLGRGAGEVAVHGSEKTQQAIEDGTAVIVKCMSCDNWMQVTEVAELMFCPICQVVCPVEKKGAATTADMGAAAQLAADAELAEKLQKEEYAGAQERRSRPRNSARQQQRQEQSQDQSWYDWLTGAPAPAPAAPATRSSPSAESSSVQSGALISAQTGEESRSYNDTAGSRESGGARVAEQKSVFSCVADSLNTAATQMAGYNIGADENGNVHGVNSEGLLAMPDVSRQRD